MITAAVLMSGIHDGVPALLNGVPANATCALWKGAKVRHAAHGLGEVVALQVLDREARQGSRSMSGSKTANVRAPLLAGVSNEAPGSEWRC